ncbi:Esterase/lipase/thioesterase [Favolaschia claudopus]|uniref:Esterase/lipase/thioesterase n=1 Tax=Favolaschia claudopus TaxID=2862362 RepID=A0AAV9ZX46_9AGAR
MAQYVHLSIRDPEVPDIPSFAVTRETMYTLRQALDIPLEQRLENFKGRLPAESTYKVEDHPVAVDGAEITIRAIIPTPTSDEGTDFEFPLMFFIHGGGWCVGDLSMDDFDLRILSVNCRVVVVSVDYRLAPEHPFPIPVEDSYTAMKWTVDNAHSLHASPDKGFLTCGVSAGGNLAAVVTQRSVKDPFFAEHKITGSILQIPVTINPRAPPAAYASELLSYEQNANAPILTRAAMEVFADCYAAPPTSPDFSPLLGDLTGLPHTQIGICGLDPLRDEGLLYERLLREHGVTTRLHVYPGVPHGFPSMFPLTKMGRKWEVDWHDGVKWLLQFGRAK